MRLIGLAERTLERMCRRADARAPFGRPLSEQGVTLERIADARLAIDQARLLTLKAASAMDRLGNKEARADIAMIKIAAPAMAQKVIDMAMQAFGGGGTANDHFLASAFATARLLRLADGPDEVHRQQLARLELKRHRNQDPARTGGSAEVLDVPTVRNRFSHLHPSAPDYLWA
jgi:alkylation response protein AidB-like acyl-CoA dehydrogenase